MYTAHFGFREIPFNIAPDPRFCFSTPIHEEIYNSLLADIRSRAGGLLLTGDSGAGKTTLLHRLMNDVDDPIYFVLFSNTNLTFDELLLSVCNDLGLEPEPGSTSDYLNVLHEFLIERDVEGVGVCLFIDEAQELSAETLAQLDSLFALQRDGIPLLQIVLSGQSTFEETLRQPAHNDLSERIVSRYQLPALLAHEVGPFIQHRITVAGGERQDIFPPDVVERIVHYSQNIPRLINVICDNALLVAYTLSQDTVSLENIEEVVQTLNLATESDELTLETDATADVLTADSQAQAEEEENPSSSFAEDQTLNTPQDYGAEVSEALTLTGDLFGPTEPEHPALAAQAGFRLVEDQTPDIDADAITQDIQAALQDLQGSSADQEIPLSGGLPSPVQAPFLQEGPALSEEITLGDDATMPSQASIQEPGQEPSQPQPSEDPDSILRFLPPADTHEAVADGIPKNESEPSSAEQHSAAPPLSPDTPDGQEQQETSPQPEMDDWTTAVVPADEIAAAKVANDVGEGIALDTGETTSWEEEESFSHEEEPTEEVPLSLPEDQPSEENVHSQLSQWDQHDQLHEPLDEHPQPTRSRWLTRIALGITVLIVLGGAGFALFSQASSDWACTRTFEGCSVIRNDAA